MWWYGLGWTKLLHAVSGRVQAVLSFFSVGQLFRSLFAPFRQISAERIQGSLSAQLQAFGDRLFSRCIGAVVRILLIICGLVTSLVVAIVGLGTLIVWPFIPVLPLLGIFFMQVRFGV